MKLTILGSGGVISIPRPTCNCRLCTQARQKGIPYARTGCSLFVHDANLLFDTPEDIRQQLNREGIGKVEHVILTHWHPDHTMGIRILEMLNFDFALERPFSHPINVYMSSYQMEMFKKFSSGGFLDFYENIRKIIRIIEIKDNEAIAIGNIKVTPVLIPSTKGFYFIIEDGHSKVIYAPCEVKGFTLSSQARDADALIVHNLWYETEGRMPAHLMGKSWIKEEDSFESMLVNAKDVGVKRIIITHIEEIFGKDYDELTKLGEELGIEFAFDGMHV